MENDCSCPICREMMIMPRLYDCGHSICEVCMIKNDNMSQDNNTNIFQLPVFKCPICRNETNGEWHTRPINHSLIQLFSQNEEYQKATKEYKEKHKTPDTHADNQVLAEINLGYIVHKKRMQKCEKIYKKLLPVLMKAAMAGKPYIIITTHTTEIQMVADLLAKKLFKNNGIYKLQSSYRECQIEFVPSDRTYKSEYENPTFSLEDQDDDDSDDSDDSENDQEFEEELPSARILLPRLSVLAEQARLHI